MQQPILRTAPPVNQPVNRNVPNIIGNRGGWYPRWWVLSAFISSVLLLLLTLFGRFFACSATSVGLCNVASWHPVLQVAVIWAAFVLIWLLAFIFGVGTIEVPRRDRSSAAEFFRSLSEFGPLRFLLLLYGVIALWLLVVLWFLDRTTPISFAFLSMVVFVANCSFFHGHSAVEQRRYLIGYGVIALFAFIMTALYRSQNVAESPFLLAEGLLILSCIVAVIRRPRQAQLTAQQLVNANINRAASPLYVLRSLWPINRFFPNRPGNVGNP
jgi:hypothetical protein